MMKNQKVAILATNFLPITEDIKKGTELFIHQYCKELSEYLRNNSLPLDVTVYCSPDSDIPFPKKSPFPKASINNPEITPANYKWYEIAHIAYALNQSNEYDLLHVHISNGEWLLPFLPTIQKPTLITMHGGDNNAYDPGIFNAYEQSKLLHFISISHSQRQRLPHLNYAKTIYHGVDIEDMYSFSPNGGSCLLWAGRAVPEKGLHTIIDVYQSTHYPTILCPIDTAATHDYLKKTLSDQEEKLKGEGTFLVNYNMQRDELAKLYKQSKAFLFPIHWEEPFGLVLIESLASGTPVIAFARGSAPEIIQDGKTGLLVNPSDSDKRGDYIVTSSGTQGFIEAVHRLMALPEIEYKAMRQACRQDAEHRFSQQRMIEDYLQVYQSLTP